LENMKLYTNQQLDMRLQFIAMVCTFLSGSGLLFYALETSVQKCMSLMQRRTTTCMDIVNCKMMQYHTQNEKYKTTGSQPPHGC